MKYRGYLIDLLRFNYQNLQVKVLSPIEIRVRTNGGGFHRQQDHCEWAQKGTYQGKGQVQTKAKNAS